MKRTVIIDRFGSKKMVNIGMVYRRTTVDSHLDNLVTFEQNELNMNKWLIPNRKAPETRSSPPKLMKKSANAAKKNPMESLRFSLCPLEFKYPL